MGAPGGRRSETQLSVHLSAAEKQAIEVARGVRSHWACRDVSMADWLAMIAHRVLLDGLQTDLPESLRTRAREALAALEAEWNAEVRVGRPPKPLKP